MPKCKHLTFLPHSTLFFGQPKHQLELSDPRQYAVGTSLLFINKGGCY